MVNSHLLCRVLEPQFILTVNSEVFWLVSLQWIHTTPFPFDLARKATFFFSLFLYTPWVFSRCYIVKLFKRKKTKKKRKKKKKKKKKKRMKKKKKAEPWKVWLASSTKACLCPRPAPWVLSCEAGSGTCPTAVRSSREKT